MRKIEVANNDHTSYYKKYIEKKINRKALCLPSTSPANAAWNIERLTE
jgi:hypothetical protein